MPSIDTTAIENFDSLDADQLRDYIKGFTYEDNADALAKAQDEAKRNKAAFDKAAHEVADYKKQLKDAQSNLANAQADGENRLNEANSASEKRIADLEEQVKGFQRDKSIAEHTARFIGLGYAADLAAATAVAYEDGDTDTVFANQQKFMEEHDKAVKSAAVQKPTKPNKGNTDPDNGTTKTRKDLMAMSQKERADFYRAHPDEYREIYNKK